MSDLPDQEKIYRKIDLLETLLGKEILGPDSINISDTLEWFAVSEREDARKIIEEMHNNQDCPLKYEIGDHTRVWLRDKEETEEFIRELRDSPPWFE